MSEEERHAVAVAAVILDEQGRVLLVRRRDHGTWEPPGGTLKVGEGIEDALRREVEEETHLDIAVERLTGVYENPRHGVLSLVFRCALRAGVEGPSTETIEAAWTDTDHAPQVLTAGYAQWVSDAIGAPAVAVRQQRDTIMGASSSPASPFPHDED
jgi:ADP-ribose pyrophosphatase YjhB (NUDIX family)